MPNEPVRVYWDSCVYIACIQKEPKRFGVLRAIMKMVEDGDIVLVASALILAEVIKLNASTQKLATQAKKIREFFENDYIKVRSVGRTTAEAAAAISRKYGLKPPDAIHVATAIETNCRYFQTYDGENGDAKRLLAFNGKIGSPALAICLPATIAKEIQTEIPLPADDADSGD
jgi:predicted nucleic acid-binding protein